MRTPSGILHVVDFKTIKSLLSSQMTIGMIKAVGNQNNVDMLDFTVLMEQLIRLLYNNKILL